MTLTSTELNKLRSKARRLIRIESKLALALDDVGSLRRTLVLMERECRELKDNPKGFRERVKNLCSEALGKEY